MMEVRERSDDRDRVARLSPRQIECLRLVYERRTSKEIAAEIGLSAATVDSYITEAVSLLRARNRRHAAELLHAIDTPEKFGSRSPRDEAPAEALQAAPKRPIGWTDWLLFRQPGATGNDFRPAYRILFIPLGAIILITAFGMLASAARIVSDILAAWFR